MPPKDENKIQPVDFDSLSLEEKVAYLQQINAKATEDYKTLSETAEKTADDLAQLREDYDKLDEKYDELEKESAEEIGRLSKELANTKLDSGKNLLSITIDEERYTTKAGRSYNIGGKTVKIEDLVQDEALCAKLIAANSPIFKKSEQE